MAQDEYSMNEYFSEGLEDEEAPETKREKRGGGEKKEKKKAPKKKRGGRARTVLIVLCVAAVLIVLIWLLIYLRVRSDDGARIAKKLSLLIGTRVTDAEKSANVTLSNQSDYAVLQNAAISSGAYAQSRKTCDLEGVKLPQWAILCGTDGENLQNVVYYNFEALEKNLFGTPRKAYIETNLIQQGAKVQDVEDTLDLPPYSVTYGADKTETRVYRYCYEDPDNHSDTVSYVITAVWGEDDNLISITDARINYIESLLFGTPS